MSSLSKVNMNQWQHKSTEELAVGEQLWLTTGTGIFFIFKSDFLFCFVFTASLINWGKKSAKKKIERRNLRKISVSTLASQFVGIFQCCSFSSVYAKFK